MDHTARTAARRLIIPLGLVLGAGLLAGVGQGPAAAAPKVVGEFAIDGVGTNNQIAVGPDGNIWVTEDAATKDIARITPNGTVTQYDPATINSPIGITAGPDGKLWVTQAGGVASFTAANPNGAVATPIADITQAQHITSGPDGNLWTASGDKVIKIPPAAPATFTSYAATGVLGARGISSDGTNLWVADFGGQQIVRVTTAGAGTKFPTGGGPQGVAATSKSTTVGYADPTTNPQHVGRIVNGSAPKKTLTPMKDPFGAAYGDDGAFWFAQFAGKDLGRLTKDGKYTELGGFSAGSGPRQITAGPGHTLWVTLAVTNKIAKVTGVITSPGPSPTPTPTPSTSIHTKITKHPHRVVHLGNHRTKARVAFRFRSPDTGATFECKLRAKHGKRAHFSACTSPRRYRLAKGSYTFSVRARVGSKVDASAAKQRVRIKRHR